MAWHVKSCVHFIGCVLLLLCPAFSSFSSASSCVVYCAKQQGQLWMNSGMHLKRARLEIKEQLESGCEPGNPRAWRAYSSQ